MKAEAVQTVSAKDRLIVALDLASAEEARRAFDALRESAGMFKVGSQLFTSAGPDFVRELVAAGARVFLDLKFHDIPNTVAAASRQAVRLGVALFNVHAAGGGEMLRRATDATTEESARLGVARPSLVAVTVLTSMDSNSLAETGVEARTVEEQVKRLARLAADSGLDGIVASPHEITLIQTTVERKPFLVVTPGVRPAASPHDDQKRVMTPAEAVRAGADFVVVVRAILKTPDPARAAREVVEEMSAALG